MKLDSYIRKESNGWAFMAMPSFFSLNFGITTFPRMLCVSPAQCHPPPIHPPPKSPTTAAVCPTPIIRTRTRTSPALKSPTPTRRQSPTRQRGRERRRVVGLRIVRVQFWPQGRTRFSSSFCCSSSSPPSPNSP